MYIGTDDWSIERATALQGEVGIAFHRQACCLNLADACQVKSLSLQIDAKDARRRGVCSASRDFRTGMSEVNIVKSGLASGNAQVGVELLDRFSIY